MKIIRLLFLFAALFPLLAPESLGDPARDHPFLVFVGTYTDKTSSKGIYAFDFDPVTGKLIPRGLAAESANPSWIAIHPNGKFAYAANESGKQSMVSAFSINAKAAKLTLLNQLPAQGEDPCYLAFDKTGNYLFAANYTSGDVTVFPVLPGGQLGAPTANVKDQGALGPNKERQEGPHAHWVGTSPDNRFLYVSDLGLDRVLIYKFDARKGTLSPGPSPMALSPGTGPRHVAFSQDHKFVYVLGEMSSAVTVFSMDGSTAHRIQEISALPKEFSGRKEAAEIAVHPSGKWLFTSNRGHDSIAVFAIDRAAGTLAVSAIVPTGGREPRHFALDPTGQFLLAGNQNSNDIAIFRINLSTGALNQVSKTDNLPSPVCLVFLPNP